MRRLLALTALAACGCGNGRFFARETWPQQTPDIRVAVLLSTPPRVVILPRSVPFQVPLDPIVKDTPKPAIWMLGYSVSRLASLFPALQGKSPEEVAAALTPELGGTGPAAPTADAVLSAQIDPTGAHDIAYDPRTWAEWQQSGAGVLRLSAPSELACAGVRLEHLDGPAGIELGGIVPTSTGSAIAAGIGIDGRLQLFQLKDATFVPLATFAEMGPIRGRPAWDPVTRSGYVVSKDGQLVRFGPAGERLPVPDRKIVDAGNQRFGVTAVAAGADGTVMVADFYLFALSGTQWQEIVFVQEQQRAVDLLRVVNAQRLFLFNACWIDSIEGNSARLVFADLTCGNTGTRTINDADADLDGLVAVGNRGRISIETPDGKVLDQSGKLGGSDLPVAVALRGGRHLVAGDELLWLWFGSDWCRLSVDPGIRFRFGAASRDGGTAYVIAAPIGGARTKVLRLRLPPPAS